MSRTLTDSKKHNLVLYFLCIFICLPKQKIQANDTSGVNFLVLDKARFSKLREVSIFSNILMPYLVQIS